MLRYLIPLLPLIHKVTAREPDHVRGIAWFGLETEHRNLMCTWTHDIPWNLKKIESLGFNTVRIPFSHDYITSADWKVLDELFHHVENTNLSLVLDYHRIDDTHQSPKPWIEGKLDFDGFLRDWEIVLDRYGKHQRLVGIDIWNEYQSDNYVEWNNIARQIVSHIDSKYSQQNLTYYVQGTNWAGNIHFMNLSDLACADRIRYTIHKYWFSDTEPLEEHWDYSFGLIDHDSAHINVGEWGYISDKPKEIDWAVRFMYYLKNKKIHNSFFWTWSFNSGDTGGILLPDCESVDCKKIYLLKQYWNVSHV